MHHLLLVEDNEGIVKGLTYLLEQEKYIVTAVSSIKEADSAFLKNKYSLIISTRY